jgi:hypothetical protein
VDLGRDLLRSRSLTAEIDGNISTLLRQQHGNGRPNSS